MKTRVLLSVCCLIFALTLMPASASAEKELKLAT